VSIWQMLADLSFADLLLLAPLRGDPDENLLTLAQMRPLSAQSLYPDDHVGTALLAEFAPEAAQAMASGKPQRGQVDARGVVRAAIPVKVGDHVPAVVIREGMPFGGRRVSGLEEAYSQAADALYRMIVEGLFPFPGMEEWEAPRVGEGMMLLAPSGLITFASPNAIAANRRLGVFKELVGASIQDLPGGQAMYQAMEAGVPLPAEVEVGGEVISRRLIPFRSGGENAGGLMLLQDVTEVRRRDRMLMYKDAVIREIHHRVKNNLQTIASLLRIQGRRLESEEAKAALEESVRRIRTIAFVHESLSQATSDLVDFGDVLRGVLRMLHDGLGLDEHGVSTHVQGEVGELPASIATPLSLVVTELVQNAAEHAFVDRTSGKISVTLEQSDGRLRAEVRDDGCGLPEGFSLEGAGLGLQIVRRLVEDELHGSITLQPDEGTRVDVEIPMPGYVAT
jgi:two-component sensor histidine kinase